MTSYIWKARPNSCMDLKNVDTISIINDKYCIIKLLEYHKKGIYRKEGNTQNPSKLHLMMHLDDKIVILRLPLDVYGGSWEALHPHNYKYPSDNLINSSDKFYHRMSQNFSNKSVIDLF